MIKELTPSKYAEVEIGDGGEMKVIRYMPSPDDLQKITVVPAVSSEFPNKHDIPKDLGEYTWSQPNYWTG